MKQKTVREWLEAIPNKDTRERAIKNVYPLREDMPRSCRSQALLVAFDWRRTPEGADYWENIYRWAQAMETEPCVGIAEGGMVVFNPGPAFPISPEYVAKSMYSTVNDGIIEMIKERMPTLDEKITVSLGYTIPEAISLGIISDQPDPTGHA